MYSAELLITLATFAAAAAWSPGPNNFMLAASGATFGFRRTVPHVIGVAFGFPVMIFVVTLGLGSYFRTEPALRTAIAWTGLVVMLWLAYRIATQAAPKKVSNAKPLSLWSAAAFQWVNPKAWVMCVAVAATFASGASPHLEALQVAMVFAVVGLTSASAWTAAGAGLGRWLGSGGRLRAFNALMAALLAVSAIMLVVGR